MPARMRLVGGVATMLVGALVVAVLAAAVGGVERPATVSSPAVRGAQPMDLVWISDSSGWNVARFYAQHVRTDLGVAVRVHDRWEGDLAAYTILERLRTPGHSWIRLIRNAEVIFVIGNFAGFVTARGGDCVSTGCQPPKATWPDWQPYVGALKAIYKRIFEIRRGKAVILRTANWYCPVISHAPASLFYPHVSWDECGITAACTEQFEWWARAIARAAAAYGVPVADVYAAFNGPDHLEDPVDKGYIQADGIHVNNAGRAVIARALADLGYTRVRAPR